MLKTCSTQFGNVTDAIAAFETSGWQVASEANAGQFQLENAIRGVLGFWASYRLSAYAPAFAGNRQFDAEQFEVLSDREKIVFMLARDPSEPVELEIKSVSNVHAHFVRVDENPAMLKFRFSDRKGWKQHCDLILPNTPQVLDEVTKVFGSEAVPSLKARADTKAELPPVNEEPTAVSPRAEATVLNVSLIQGILDIDPKFPTRVSTELSIAPPATTLADEANQ